MTSATGHQVEHPVEHRLEVARGDAMAEQSPRVLELVTRPLTEAEAEAVTIRRQRRQLGRHRGPGWCDGAVAN
jgi:hypothetical protein